MKSSHRLSSLNHNCAGQNITTGAWIQKTPIGVGQDCGKISWFNGSNSIILLGAGKPGLEQVIANLYPGSNPGLETIVPNNSPLSLKALDATANDGSLVIDLFT